MRVRLSLLASVVVHLAELVRGAPPTTPESWRRHVADRLGPADLAGLDVLGSPGTRLPSFLVPATGGASVALEVELEALRDTPARRVRADLARAAGATAPAAFRRFARDPRHGLDALCAALTTIWRRAYAQQAAAMTSVLERERLAAGTLLAKDGPRALLARVHGDVPPIGAFVLVPLLAGPRPPAVDPEHPDGALLAYAAPGAEALWEAVDAGAGAGGALAGVLGATRARVALAVNAPATTAELAGRLDASPSLVSQHLRGLRERGLVERRREHGAVVYELTALGRRVVDALCR